MARKIIGTGTTANDGTGDTLRQAGGKINDNFSELYTLVGGDSATLGVTSILTDSGVTLFGTSTVTRINAVDPASDLAMLFPDSGGTVVIDSAAQTLTNKTLSLDSVSGGNIISGLQNNSFVMTDSSGNISPSLDAKAIPIGIIIGDSDTQTLYNKTLDSATLVGPSISDHIYDTNNAELIELTATASAENHFRVENAATGNPPVLTAHGTDSDISIDFSGRNRGAVIIEKLAHGSSEITADGTASRQHSYIVANKGSTLNITLADGQETGEQKFFTNKGSGSAIITPTNFAQGTSVTLVQYGACHFIFDGTNWYLTGYSRDSDITIT